MQVEGLEPGVYFYNGDVNDVTLISSVDSSTSLPSYLGGQPFVSGAAAGIFVTRVLHRVWGGLAAQLYRGRAEQGYGSNVHACRN
jgi:hypothetical protein